MGLAGIRTSVNNPGSTFPLQRSQQPGSLILRDRVSRTGPWGQTTCVSFVIDPVHMEVDPLLKTCPWLRLRRGILLFLKILAHREYFPMQSWPQKGANLKGGVGSLHRAYRRTGDLSRSLGIFAPLCGNNSVARGFGCGSAAVRYIKPKFPQGIVAARISTSTLASFARALTGRIVRAGL